MHRLELIYLPPSRITVGGPFDFRMTGAVAGRSVAPAGPLTKTDILCDQASLTRALAADPPRLLGSGNQALVLLGHRRIEMARSHALEEIPLLVYPAATPKPAVIAIALSGKPDALSGVEKIIALVKTVVFVGDGAGTLEIPLASPLAAGLPTWVFPMLARLFDRTLSERFAIRLSRALTWPIDDLLRLHELSFSCEQIASLVDLTPPERRCVLRIRETTPLTASELKNLTRLLLLARGRDHFDLTAWIDDELHDRREPPTGSGILKSLVNTIHPRRAKAAASIAETIGRMAFSSRLRITPPENLEGGSFSCYFRFSDDGEIRDHVEKLDKIIKDGSAKRIIDMLDPEPRTERDD
jgi:hypothetical protein